MSKPNPFHALAEHYKRPSEIAERFGRLYEDDPHTACSLLIQLQRLVEDGPSRRNGHVSRVKGKTNLDRVIRFFCECGNEMHTKATITEQTGLSDTAIHTVLYTTGGKDVFESQRGFESKSSGFRLRSEVYEREKQKGGD